MALITEAHLEQQSLDQVILLQAADGQVSLDVRLEAATVWLSQAQMAQLFGRERSVITRHVGNVFREVVQRYSRAWRWLLGYDEDPLPAITAEPDGSPEVLGLAEAQRAIETLRADLAHCGEATALFGHDNRQALAGIRIADNGMAALALLEDQCTP